MQKKELFLGLLSLVLGLNILNAQTVTQTLYVDFGEPNVSSRGRLTEGVDAYGHYWTNVKSSGNNYAYPNTSFAVVNSDNRETGFEIFLNTRFMTNGRGGGGGLTSPSHDLLADLAVETATEDYFFLESFQNYCFMTFRGLDKNKGYKFYSFGSRVTENVRSAEFLFRGENSWSGTHQMSGKGIGENGYNGNNSTVLESGVVFPDRDGNITFTIIKHDVNGMVHINAMKVEEIDGLARPNQELGLRQTVYVDLGETDNNERGHQTTGIDRNGNYWNNLTSGKASSNRIPKGTKLEIVNSQNIATGITAETLQMMETNGVNAGGVNSPTDENLGDLAIQTATEDYVWINDDNQRQIRFSGMDKKHCYKFYIFGSRIVNETTDRNSIYTVGGQDSWSTQITTTGRCIGGRDDAGKDIQGNVRNVAVSDYMYPDKDGNITFTVKRERGMAHVNIIKIEEYEGGLRPEDALEYKSLYVSGTASEEGKDVAMKEIRPGGESTGLYEAYLMLRPGTYMLHGTTTDGESVVLGSGAEEGTVERDGLPFAVSNEQVVRVKYNSRKNVIDVTPLELYVKGNIVPDGTKLDYEGNGIWKSEVVLEHGSVFLFSDKYFYFAFNNNDALAVKRLAGSRSAVAMPSEGYEAENIRLNRGTYVLALDMNKHEFTIDAPIDEYKISVFGSSVANGQGATDYYGYAYQYGNLLQRRYRKNESDYPFYTSGVSIGGNSTVNLLNRYDELVHDFSRYVIIGLSMGNEGLHEASDKRTVFEQFANNMQTIINKVRSDGKIPVVMNNYTRGDYTASDYTYVKRMNLLIHEWDVPSVNVLGAIDNGYGKWADGYMQDTWHPTTSGHNEFLYAMPPSLFDAIADGKPQPVRDMTGEMILDKANVIMFEGENTVHPYTVSVRFKGGDSGRLFAVCGSSGIVAGHVSVDANGHVVYASLSGESLESDQVVNDGEWHTVTLTHYYAQKRTLLYVDKNLVGELSGRMSLGVVTVGDPDSDVSRIFGELFFWRSALNVNEVGAVVDGKMLKSSLEIYSPLSVTKAGPVKNMAQTNNYATFVVDANTDIDVPGNAGTSAVDVVAGVGKITVSTTEDVYVSVLAVDGRTIFGGVVDGRKELNGIASGVYAVNGRKIVVR